MQYRLLVIVVDEELPLDVYFKREETGQQWIRSNYVFVGLLVWALRKTRDYQLVLRRVS